MYVEPQHRKASFTCPHCEAVTGQTWAPVNGAAGVTGSAYGICQSTDCGEATLWVGELTEYGGIKDAVMVWPSHTPGPRPNDDMPDNVAQAYQEARKVLPHSPRAAGALLRLALQLLMPHVGKAGKNLNDEIAELVREGLRPNVQKALDAVRIIGNDAVHPGAIDTDDRETVLAMFALLNQIVYDLVTRPRELDEVWQKLPEGKRNSVGKRDGIVPSEPEAPEVVSDP